MDGDLDLDTRLPDAVAGAGAVTASDAAPEASEPRKTELYGGAASVVMPSRFIDVSDFRPVPDHQEVFADISTDQSIIVEVLTREDVPDDAAGRHFFDDLAGDNGAGSNDASIDVCEVLPATLVPELLAHLPPGGAAPVVVGLRGRQRVSKFKEAAKNDVLIYMAVVRLEAQDTDILITMNAPTSLSPDSSSAKLFTAVEPEGTSSAAVFEAAVASFHILNWGLFG